MARITVSIKLYDTARRQFAFFIDFPDGTAAWSHTWANVEKISGEYARNNRTECAILLGAA